MSDSKPFDPFKAEQPRIPGVPADAERTEGPAVIPAGARPAPEVSPKPLWLFAAIGAGALLLLVLGYFLLRPAEKLEEVAPPPPAASAPADTAAPAAAPVAAPMPIAPSEPVATVQEMSRPWSAKKFIFRNRLGGDEPALLIRLPGGSASSAAGYWAFAARPPYGKCDLELVTDRDRLRDEFGFSAAGPMVVDPCDKVVYNPMAYGSVRGAMVRGDVVKGPGFRPPRAILVRISGSQILALEIEK